MKKAQLNAFGVPAEVVTCVDAEEPAAPGAGEITIEVLAAPINPAELLLIEGRYAGKPPLPAPLGIEGAGRVVAVGPGVEDLAEGDLVMSLARTNWVERITLRAADAVKAPADIDVAQLSMLKVNPTSQDPHRTKPRLSDFLEVQKQTGPCYSLSASGNSSVLR